MDEIKKILSKQRLSSYVRENDNGDIAKTIARYHWNIELSQAFYPVLHVLEVILRNATHRAISEKYGENWLENFKHHQLNFRSNDTQKVYKAKIGLEKREKPIEEGRLIAELNFGFWTSMYDKDYEDLLWRNKKRLHIAFPNLEKTKRKRGEVSKVINRIRKLRNRIFHYEPIYHFQNLDKRYKEIRKCLMWMSESSGLIVDKFDSFDGLLQKNPDKTK